MPNFKEQYKNPRLGFGDTEESRNLRAYKHEQTRRCTRTVAFNKNRKLEDASPSNISFDKQKKKLGNDTTVVNERQAKLMKWREERERKKKLEARNKKPPFKVGVVHHSVCSPLLKSNVAVAPAKPKQTVQPQSVQKRITRATEKRLQRKTQPKNNTISTNNVQITSTKKTAPIVQKKPSFAPTNHVFRPPSRLQQMPLFGLVPYEETPQEKGDFFVKNKSKDLMKLDIKQQEDAMAKTLKRPSATNTIEMHTSAFSSTAQNSLKKVRIPSSTPCDVTAKLNDDITTLSLVEQDTQTTKDSSQEETVLLNKSDTKTSPQTSVDASSEKENDAESLIIFSPYITQSRGKRNARKEQEQRLGIRKSSLGKIPTKDTVMQDLNISAEDEERTATYFKLLLNQEVDRLQDLCLKWLAIQADDSTPEEVVYEIQQAVGQTKLLLSKKFERFRGLVRDCEAGKGEMLVTCRDLQGFWDMTYMEVKDCDLRFEKLEQRKNREWQEEEHAVAKIAVKKRKAAKKQGVPSKPSALRSMILAARKKKKETGTSNVESLLPRDINVNAERITPSQSNNRKSVVFKNSTDVQHSRRSSKFLNSKESKSTLGRRTSSVQKVQISSTLKASKSPFAIMKISQKLKTPEVQLDDTITYINSDQTPGKGILKKSEDPNKDVHVKSAQKVNFDDRVTEVPTQEEIETKVNLTAALKKIDALDIDEMYSREPIHAERKLSFESDSDDSVNSEKYSDPEEAATRDAQKSSVQITPDSETYPLNDITYLVPDEEAATNDAKSIPEVRILRNRTITTNETPKNRRSKMMTGESVNKIEKGSSIKLSRKKRLSRPENDETPNKENITKDEDVTITESIGERRKSTRKSVAFNACLICLENKPAFPVTPHTKRQSKRHSRRSKHTPDEDIDLISWDTPERSGRVTRSYSRKN